PSLPAAVRVERYAEEEVSLVVETPRKAVLVLTDLYWPGWQVDVDGERRVLQRADFLFRAVALGAGVHRVHFRYGSFTFRLGLLVTALPATAVLAILVFEGIDFFDCFDPTPGAVHFWLTPDVPRTYKRCGYIAGGPSCAPSACCPLPP